MCRFLFTGFLLCISAFLPAQPRQSNGQYQYSDITYKDFLESGYTSIERYDYQIKKNGKISRDSHLVFRKTFNPSSRMITGHYAYTISGRQVKSAYTRKRLLKETFQYDSSGRLVSEIKFVKAFGKKGSVYSHDITTIVYTYDSRDSIEHEFKTRWVYEFRRKGTMLDSQLKQMDKSEKHHAYNSAGLRTKVFNGSENTPEKEWLYNAKGQLIRFVDYWAGSPYAVRHFKYEEDRIVKVVDSAGLGLQGTAAVETRTTLYRYESGKLMDYTMETFLSNARQNDYWYKQQKWSADGVLLSFCSGASRQACYRITYEPGYEVSRLVSVVVTTADKKKFTRTFAYTAASWLAEVKVVKAGNKRMVGLTRYHYKM